MRWLSESLRSGRDGLSRGGDEPKLVLERAAESRHRRARKERRGEPALRTRRQVERYPMLVLPDHGAAARIERPLVAVASDDAQRDRTHARGRARILNIAVQFERRSAPGQFQLVD